MLLTTDQAQFLEAWAGPTPPQLATSDNVRRGEVISAMLMFSGCTANQAGKCELRADYLISAPDGSVYGDSKDVKVWDEAPAPGHNIQLSQSNLSIQIEPGEQLGRYRIRIALTDKVAGTRLEVSDEFTALEAEPPSRVRGAPQN